VKPNLGKIDDAVLALLFLTRFSEGKGELAVTRGWKSHDREALNGLLDFGVVLRPRGSKGVNPMKTAKPSKPFVDAD
jgi:hypothetical protein